MPRCGDDVTGSSSQDGQCLRARTELLCFLWLQPIAAQISGEDVFRSVLSDKPLTFVSYARLSNAGFSAAEVDALVAESQAEAPGDQLVTRGKDQASLQVHNMLLKFAVEKYLQPYLTRIGPPIGEWFEEDYLLRYLGERLDSSRCSFPAPFLDNGLVTALLHKSARQMPAMPNSSFIQILCRTFRPDS